MSSFEDDNISRLKFIGKIKKGDKINVKDMARAIDWAILRDKDNGGQFLICNTGSNIWNYTVKELADFVSQRLENIKISVNKDAPADKRSYRVNFDLFTSLAKDFTPQIDVVTTINELKSGLEAIDFSDIEFRKSNFMRLNQLNDFLEKGKLDSKLNWVR